MKKMLLIVLALLLALSTCTALGERSPLQGWPRGPYGEIVKQRTEVPFDPSYTSDGEIPDVIAILLPGSNHPLDYVVVGSGDGFVQIEGIFSVYTVIYDNATLRIE